jgi:hypothetical protein
MPFILGRLATGALLALACVAPAHAQYLGSTARWTRLTRPRATASCQTAASTCTLRAAIEEANATPGQHFVQLEHKTYTRTIASELEPLTMSRSWTDQRRHRRRGGPAGCSACTRHDGIMYQLVVRGGWAVRPRRRHPERRHARAAAERRHREQRQRRRRDRECGPSDRRGLQHLRQRHGSDDLQHGRRHAHANAHRFQRGSRPPQPVPRRPGATELRRNEGGGILNEGNLEIRNSTLWENGGYGALYNHGTAALKRSTVSGNRGDVVSAVFADAGLLTLENVTIGANGDAGSPEAALDGYDGVATIRVLNSIVGGNAGSGGDPDCRVSVTSLGHNLMSCPLEAPDPTTFAADPRLAPLKTLRVLWPSSVYTTLIHPLLPGSPAIDRGSCLTAFADQRGAYRPEGPRCDIGAFEATPLCRGGVGMGTTRLTVRRRPLPAGTTTIKVKARLPFTDPLAPAVDPAADGLQLRIEDLGSPGGALVEHTDVTQPLVFGGWEASGPRFRWHWPILPDPLAVLVKDRRATAGFVDFKATTKAVLPPALGPMRVTVVLGGQVIGDDDAGNVGACASHVFTCTAHPSGTKLKCS